MSLETYGRYQLLKKLATGGMAQIYLARQVGLEGFEKLLVVKRILPHLAENEEFITMFLDEARIAARLNHPNVVQIFDLGAQDETFFIAMEYIHGEDVRRVWKQSDRLGVTIPIPLICRMVIEACNGLDYAHKKADPGGRALNIVHRDISPQNILVSFEGHVKIVDFGIAKAADQATVTRSGVLKGKYSYMSPEQAAGKGGIDCRTDIFAVGVVLYELLTGARLFKRATDIQTLNAVSECQVAPPSESNPRIPKDLERIAMKALAKSRDDRFQEARLLAAALEDWLLSHKQPSSTVHLAAFMQEIYAERLAREAEEGRLQAIESAESAQDIEKATPSSASREPRPTRSLRSPVPESKSLPGVNRAPDRSAEATVGERPNPARSGAISKPRAVDKAIDQAIAELPGEHKAPTEASMPTQRAGGGRGPLAIALIGTLVLVVAGLAYALFQKPDRAHVTIASEPGGAKVRLAGNLLDCVTPCAIPAMPAGTYSLTLAKPGFRDFTTTVAVPQNGALSIPFSLVKEELTGKLVCKTTPMGAEVWVDGKNTGRKTPVVAASAIELPAGKHTVAFKLDGVSTPTHELTVEAGAQAQLSDSFEVKVAALALATDPPGATVFVGSDKRGLTPVTLQVAPGQLGVRFELEGYAPLSDSLTVGAEGATRTFTLKPVKATVVVHPKNQHKNPVETPPEVKTAVGTVRFVVNPWATVECAGAGAPLKFGETPFEDKKIPAGEYRCTFLNPDLNQQQTKTVVVEAGTVTTVKVKFAAE